MFKDISLYTGGLDRATLGLSIRTFGCGQGTAEETSGHHHKE